jgi:radical SAM superfamily enzyme YgiQ (UPF0313 family)
MARGRFEHVVCVYPYRRGISKFICVPPLGLEYVAAVIEPHAQALEIADLRKEAGRTKDFLRPETDCVCFSVNWDRDADFVREEILSVPPHILTIIGGRHASEDPGHWLTACPNVTIVVRGDGEEPMEEICRGVPLRDIAGISFRRDGQIIHNPVRRLGPIQDDPLPARHLRRHAYPLTLGGVSIGVSVDMVAGSRGCPFNCTFCSFNRNPWGEKRNWSGRSPESIVGELAGISAEIVTFSDDLFTHDMDRVAKICDLILQRGIRKKYIINARLEIARRPDVLRKMEAAGFALLLGIESAQDKTLRSMRKGFDIARIREYCRVLKDYRMFLHGYFILGNIGETPEEMLQIAPFARDLGLDTISLSSLRASPYSGLDELVAAHHNYHISPNGRIYSDQVSLKTLRLVRRKINLDFYTPGRLMRLARKGIRNGLHAFLPAIAPRLPLVLAHTARSWLPVGRRKH